MKMLCPFELEYVEFRLIPNPDGPGQLYQCPSCKEEIPKMYVQNCAKFPPTVVSTVGFRGHGKTVYFASLFKLLVDGALSRCWSKQWFRAAFSCQPLTEACIRTVYDNAGMLKDGKLPESTPQNFPKPTLVQFHDVPIYGDRTFLFFDTAGEAFQNVRGIGQYARFVAHAPAVIFLSSISDQSEPGPEMSQQLNTYLIALERLGGVAKQQHLVVVFSKPEEVTKPGLAFGAGLEKYLEEGTVAQLKDLRVYLRGLNRVSALLREYASEKLKADGFMSLAGKSFKSVSFCLTSSLGCRPDGRRVTALAPKRVMDPLLWILDKSNGK